MREFKEEHGENWVGVAPHTGLSLLTKAMQSTGSTEPSAELKAATEKATVLAVDAAALSQWLTPAAGQRLEDHLYLVDPIGNWMMRFPAQADPKQVKRDLDRLLRASAFWDKAGR